MNLLFRKIINIVLIVLCFFTIVGCDKDEETATPAEVSISITPSATTIATEEVVSFTVIVTGCSDTSFTWNISHPELLSVDVNYNARLIAAPTVDTDITVTVTANADKTKSSTTTIKAIAEVVIPTIPEPVVGDVVVGIEGASEVKSAKSINLTAVVSGSDNKAVTWEIISGEEYATINSEGVLTAKSVESDYNVKVQVTSVADPTKSAVKTITVVGKPELTQDMLDEISSERVSFDGYIQIDLYTTGIFEKFYQTYNTPVKTSMDGQNWYAEYQNGDTGTTMQMFYKKNNDLACQVGVSFMNEEEYYPMLDDFGNEISWEEAGLYNSLMNLSVDDFVFNEDIWRYEYVGSKVVVDRVIASANPYDFDATGFSLIIEEGCVLGIHSKANADYSIVAGYKAMQQLFVLLNYGNTVKVPTISKYSHEDIHDDLQIAIDNMRNLESYTLDFIESTATLGYQALEVGFTETITSDDCYFEPFDVTYDLNGEIVKKYQKGATYGYKRINDNLYNTYFEEANGFVATRAYEKDFSNAKPTFAFAAEIFREYYVDSETGETTYFVDPIMSTVSSTFYYGVGNDINLYGIFATSEEYLTGQTYKPYVVVKDGYIVEAGFYYFIGSIYGIVEIKYSNFDEATIPSDVNIEFETRHIPTSWSQLTLQKSEDDSSSTADDIEVNALDYLKEFFGDENIESRMPFFEDVLGDTYGFGMTTMHLPSGGNMLLPAIMFYYDVPLDLDYTIDSSIEAVENYLVSCGFVKNNNGWFQKADICIAPTDSSLDFVIYVWKAI